MAPFPSHFCCTQPTHLSTHLHRVVHAAYADVWEAFGNRWIAADPENVMAFPTIWAEVQKEQRRRYRGNGMKTLALVC